MGKEIRKVCVVESLTVRVHRVIFYTFRNNYMVSHAFVRIHQTIHLISAFQHINKNQLKIRKDK